MCAKCESLILFAQRLLAHNEEEQPRISCWPPRNPHLERYRSAVTVRYLCKDFALTADRIRDASRASDADAKNIRRTGRQIDASCIAGKTVERRATRSGQHWVQRS